ncbi:response regulator transcription factor [Senegalia massiliensis]|uniref:Stage 0 sporulation protein A homolog n=1 Tax=Senegalia massiliensis TaxID=1720316 RepID=A0A845R2X3_9CLOT|nr:response regulator transcription factor [Senegalia massiliensis]NBI07782.1 DNA-binding response regulator [Senegalia massiliensis]
MGKILVLEDEESIRKFIKINLKRAGYEVIEAVDGEEALQKSLYESEIDVAILDVMLPGIDGFSVCKQLRKNDKQIGIIMLTARTQEIDKITGLSIGADDYVTKPFSPSELVARVDALYRRVKLLKKNKSDYFMQGPFKIDLKGRQLYKNGKIIELTPIEYDLIYLFLMKPNKALSRNDIIDSVWGKDYFGYYKAVDVNIRRLRKKIEDNPSEPKYIETVWGYGYRWKTN